MYLLDAKMKEIIERNKGLLGKELIMMEASEYIESVVNLDEFGKITQSGVVSKILEKTSDNSDEITISKKVAEKLGISIIEFYNLPKENIQTLIEEERIKVINENVLKVCEELKENFVKEGVIKDIEKFDALTFMSYTILMTQID